MTNIPDNQIQPALMWLCRPKVGILEKSNPKVATFQDAEKILVTASFVSANVKVIFTPTT
jgi:hypothetical protein